MKLFVTIILCIGSLICSAESQAQSLVYEGESGIGKGKHIVFVANDHEYRSEQSCPALAKLLAKHHGFKCTVLFGVDKEGFIRPGVGNVPGLEVLAEADLLFFFTRFMHLSDDQADLIADYFERGGPAVGVRTSTHCFNGQKGKWAKLNFNYGDDDYRGGLGEQVFGNTWNKERGQSHYGTNHVMGCRITAVATAETHPILTGVGNIHAYSGAYESKPPADAVPLVNVQVLNTFGPSDDLNMDKPLVNAGWVREHYIAPSGAKKDARIVYASFGASEDLQDENCRRFLANACLWAGGLEDKITADLDVSLVGKYSPTPYSSSGFWYQQVKPSDLAGWDSQIMPADSKLAGVDNPKIASRSKRLLESRPEIKAKLVTLHPELYGPADKLPPASPKEK
ncbi:MAG: hypothetical protein ABJZ55_17485 [Fuerstiella sp.]